MQLFIFAQVAEIYRRKRNRRELLSRSCGFLLFDCPFHFSDCLRNPSSFTRCDCALQLFYYNSQKRDAVRRFNRHFLSPVSSVRKMKGTISIGYVSILKKFINNFLDYSAVRFSFEVAHECADDDAGSWFCVAVTRNLLAYKAFNICTWHFRR